MVEAVGADVSGFSKGDRVAGFHAMMTPNGSYAEYAILPAYTTFHIPANISLEEAATIPLAAYTAAVAVNYELEIPAPWDKAPKDSSRAVLIYGISSAIGAYALKILNHAGFHPVVGVGSKNSSFVTSLLANDKGDAFVDYTQFDTQDKLAEELGRVLKNTGAKSFCAFDCVTQHDTHVMLSKALASASSPNSEKPRLTVCLPGTDVSGVDPSVEVTTTSVGRVHKEENNGQLFGSIWTSALASGLKEGWFTPHPHECLQGLENVETALKGLREGTVRGKKMVIRVAEGK